MGTQDSAGDPPAAAKEAGKSLYEGTLDVLMTGIAIIVPLVITVYVLNVALGFVGSALRPFIALLEYFGLIAAFKRVELVVLLIDLGVIDLLEELIALAILLGVIIVVGSLGHHRYGERVIDMVDLMIASIPGIGTVYKSFRRMGDVMLDDTAENFQDIRLVETLGDEMYVIGFETAIAPPAIGEATGHDEMVTMFLPLAPNPVTGGFLTYVPRERVHDVDMTIEEGIRSILTSGVASGDGDDFTEVTMGELDQLTDLDLEDAITVNKSDDDEKDD